MDLSRDSRGTGATKKTIYPNHRDVSWKTRFVNVVYLGNPALAKKIHDFALVGGTLTFLQAQFLDHKIKQPFF